MHGTGRSSGKTLTLTEMIEAVGPIILSAFNSTKKVGTLLGGKPDENITCPEIVDTVGTSLTISTKCNFLCEKLLIQKMSKILIWKWRQLLV